jgi:hypothetical protein
MKGNEQGTHRRFGAIAIVVVAASALALTACSGGSDDPHVASLGTSVTNRNAGTTTTLPTGNPTVILDEWAACMRSHGDPNQADPTVDANKDIDITWNPAVTGGYNGTYKGGQGNDGPGQYCRTYLNAAQSALGGNRQPPPPSAATLEKLSQCMRANGVPDFPDSTNGTLVFNVGAGGDLNPNSPTFQNAAKVCEQRTGAHLPGMGGPPPPGTIRLNGAGPLP